MNQPPLVPFLLLALTLAAGAASDAASAATEPVIAAPPAALNLDPFYRKHLDARGIPVISSAKVADAALVVAAEIVEHMLALRPDVRAAMIRGHARVGVMAASEVTLDMPEHRDLPKDVPWNTRARGLGGTPERPLTSCAEENLLHQPGDPYVGENILVHEFAHAMHLLGLNGIDGSFEARLDRCYAEAIAKNLWQKTYAAENAHEYWAEGAQDWFDCNRTASPANGIHNHIGTRAQLHDYDPALYDLLATVFPNDGWRPR